MLDIAEELHRWVEQGRDFAVATVVAINGSAPRQPGAALAVDTDGTAIGSVSGGCVEGAVYELCQEALQDRAAGAGALRLQRRGRLRRGPDLRRDHRHPRHPGTDERPAPPATAERGNGGQHCRTLAAALAAAARGRRRRSRGSSKGPPNSSAAPCWSAPTAATPAPWAATPPSTAPPSGRPAPCWTPAAPRPSRSAPDSRTRRRARGARADAVPPTGAPPRRIVRPRPADDRLRRHRLRLRAGQGRQVPQLPRHGLRRPPRLRHRTRFPDADEIVVDWPHRYLDSQDLDARTVLCVLTHDAKFDVPLLERALRLPVAYVGAMGSRRTHLDRQRAAARHRRHRARTGPAALTDRPRPRRPHPRGDRAVHRRRDRRQPARRHRRPAHRRAHPHPPRHGPAGGADRVGGLTEPGLLRAPDGTVTWCTGTDSSTGACAGALGCSGPWRGRAGPLRPSVREPAGAGMGETRGTPGPLRTDSVREGPYCRPHDAAHRSRTHRPRPRPCHSGTSTPVAPQ